ncbi:MAG: NAD-dependent dehydratase [Burkholderiales bacterium]|nr:NAD-dependent dehydratase [Burkholderiales bacterium]
MKLMLVGASGLVGQQVLRQALADPAVDCLIAPTRKPLAAAARLDNPIVDFEHLPADAPWWSVDAVICTLGTTMAQAGSQAAFRRVDYDYPLAVARLARSAGATAFVLNTALGAAVDSRVFYNRVKGEVEQAISQLDYPSLTLVRPSLLDGGPRPDSRPGEGVGLVFAKILRPLLPRRYRAVSTEAVARTLLAATRAQAPGIHVVESEQIA